MSTLNIDVLKGVAGRITLFGAEHDVLDLTAEELIAQSASGDMATMREIVRRIVPTASADDFRGLTAKQVAAIYGFAAGGIDAVESLFPNVGSPSPTAGPG